MCRNLIAVQSGHLGNVFQGAQNEAELLLIADLYSTVDSGVSSMIGF